MCDGSRNSGEMQFSSSPLLSTNQAPMGASMATVEEAPLLASDAGKAASQSGSLVLRIPSRIARLATSSTQFWELTKLERQHEGPSSGSRTTRSLSPESAIDNCRQIKRRRVALKARGASQPIESSSMEVSGAEDDSFDSDDQHSSDSDYSPSSGSSAEESDSAPFDIETRRTRRAHEKPCGRSTRSRVYREGMYMESDGESDSGDSYYRDDLDSDYCPSD